VFTSNFARIKRLPADLRPVAISIGIPSWYRGDRELRLAPTRESLPWPRERFDPFYDSILAGLDPAQLYADLGPNAVLLCWESPNVWCHRRRVAEWLETSLGIVVPEFGFDRAEVLPYLKIPPKQPRNR
jgi:hypothetical protein